MRIVAKGVRAAAVVFTPFAGDQGGLPGRKLFNGCRNGLGRQGRSPPEASAVPQPKNLRAFPVSPLVNDPKNDGPGCLVTV
jgi:hypothetical protein